MSYFPKWATHYGYSKHGHLIIMGGIPIAHGGDFLMFGSKCHCLGVALYFAVPPMSDESSAASIKEIPHQCRSDSEEAHTYEERIEELEDALADFDDEHPLLATAEGTEQ